METFGQGVSLKEIIKEFQLEILYMGEEDVIVNTADVNRPGLPLTGFTELYQPHRVQIIGREEYAYLSGLEESVLRNNVEKFLSAKPICVIISSSIEPQQVFYEMAEKYDVPLLRTAVRTSEFMASLINSLRVKVAPMFTRHGVMVEVYGIGILILGDSGIGKSETAIELIKRGHRLIADDAVEIRRVSSKTLVARAPDLIRHYIELRGIGIVDIRRLFGIGSVKETENLGVTLTPAGEKDYMNNYTTKNLPNSLHDFRDVVLTFGVNDRLWRIIAYGNFIKDDASASGVLKIYRQYFNLLSQKYGNAQEFYTPNIINVDKTVTDERGKQKTVTEQKKQPLGNPDFLQELENGTAELYATFENGTIGAALGVNVDGNGQSYITVDYKNLKLMKEREAEMLNAL